MIDGELELSLIATETLIKEIESRCCSFICAYEFYKDKREYSKFYYGKGKWSDSVRLASVLNNDVLNNWNGELRTLQRIAEDESND